MGTRSKRNSNVEILRIVSMLFITLHHFSLWGQGNRSDALMESGQGLQAFKAMIYLPLGDIGVYAFVMITGFYLGAKEISNKSSIKKALSVYSQLYFYSFIFLIIALFMGLSMNDYPDLIDPIFPIQNSSNIFKALLPVSFNEYWFVTAYILLMLFLPYINRALHGLNRNNMFNLLVIVIVSTGIFPLLKNSVASETLGLGILIASYLMGMYIRKFVPISRKNMMLGIILFIVNMAIIYGVSMYNFAILHNRYLDIYTGFFAIMAATGLFLFFVNIKPRHSKVINQIAKHMFSVYLITENIFVVRILWTYFHFSNVKSLKLVNLYGLLAVIAIMIACYLIDNIRALIFVSIKNLYIKANLHYSKAHISEQESFNNN